MLGAWVGWMLGFVSSSVGWSGSVCVRGSCLRRGGCWWVVTMVQVGHGGCGFVVLFIVVWMVALLCVGGRSLGVSILACGVSGKEVEMKCDCVCFWGGVCVWSCVVWVALCKWDCVSCWVVNRGCKSVHVVAVCWSVVCCREGDVGGVMVECSVCARRCEFTEIGWIWLEYL